MNVLILNPPRRDGVVMVKEGRCMQRKDAWCYVMSPITMVTMATMLRGDGHNVLVIDAGVELNDFGRLFERVKKFRPDVALINTSTPTIDDDVHAARSLKEHCGSEVVTALFGIHVSVHYADVLKAGNGVDYCVIGEPEWTARELVAALANGGNPGKVRSLARAAAGGGTELTGARERFGSLDELPLPDWNLVDTGNYRLPLSNERFLLINTNRGCPHHCTFCNAHVYYGRAPRRRSVEHFMRELRNDVERFGVTQFLFWAEEFLLDRNYVSEICRAILDSGLNISWACNSRVDAVDEEMLALMRRAGCWNIAFGIESGVPEILTQIHKNVTVGQTARAVSLAKKCGLAVTGHVILGFPGDSAETMAATERFVDNLDLDFVQFYCAMPYPGTELYREAARNGWIRTNDWRLWEHNVSVMDYPLLKAEDIMRIRRSYYLRFYFRPKTIARVLRTAIKHPGDALTLMRNAGSFLRWI